MKVLILGKSMCPQCDEVTEYLYGKGLEFDYKHLDELEKKEQLKYKKLSIASQILSFPIIVKIVDNVEKVVTVEDLEKEEE